MEEVKINLPFVTVNAAREGSDSDDSSIAIQEEKKKFSSFVEASEVKECSEFKKFSAHSSVDHLTHVRVFYSSDIYRGILLYYLEQMIMKKNAQELELFISANSAFLLNLDPQNPHYAVIKEALRILERICNEGRFNKASAIILLYKFFYLNTQFVEGLVRKLFIQIKIQLQAPLLKFFEKNNLLTQEALQKINLETCFQEGTAQNLGILYIKDVLEKLLMIRINFFNSKHSVMMEKAERQFPKDPLSLANSQANVFLAMNSCLHVMYHGSQITDLRNYELLDAELKSILILENWPVTNKVFRLECLHAQHQNEYRAKLPCEICAKATNYRDSKSALKAQKCRDSSKPKSGISKALSKVNNNFNPHKVPNRVAKQRPINRPLSPQEEKQEVIKKAKKETYYLSEEEEEEQELEKPSRERFNKLITTFRKKDQSLENQSRKTSIKESSIKDTKSSGTEAKPSSRALKPDNMLDTDSDISESSTETAPNFGQSKVLLHKPQSLPSIRKEDVEKLQRSQGPGFKKEEMKIQEAELKQDVQAVFDQPFKDDTSSDQDSDSLPMPSPKKQTQLKQEQKEEIKQPLSSQEKAIPIKLETNDRYKPKESLLETPRLQDLPREKRDNDRHVKACGHSIGSDAQAILKALQVRDDVCFECEGPLSFSALVSSSDKLSEMSLSHRTLKSQKRQKAKKKKCIYCQSVEQLEKLPLCEHYCCAQCYQRQVKRINKRGEAYAVSCECGQLIPLSFLKVYGLAIKVTKLEVKSACCPGFSALVGISQQQEEKGVNAKCLTCYHCGIERCLICQKKLKVCTSGQHTPFNLDNLGSLQSKKYFHLKIGEDGSLECLKCSRILNQCTCPYRKFCQIKCSHCMSSNLKMKLRKYTDQHILKCSDCHKRSCTQCDGKWTDDHKCEKS